MSAVLAVAPGVWRIRLPFNLELNHVNVHVLRAEDGYVLVDSGAGSDESLDVLGGALRELAVDWRDIRVLFITHSHPDHIGAAARVRELTGAPVWMSEIESAGLERFRRWVDHPEGMNPWLLRWGAPPDTVERINDSFQFMRHSYHPAHADQFVAGGADIAGWTAVFTPGHAPGHLCLHRAADRTLISGDHVLAAISPNIAWQEGRDALGQYYSSLRAVAALDVDAILPSHGDPFTGLRERCAALASHHDQRCANIVDAIGAEESTAQQIAERLWRRALSPFQHRFALFEVMAHLVWLESNGRVVRVDRGDVEAWRAAQAPM